MKDNTFVADLFHKETLVAKLNIRINENNYNVEVSQILNNQLMPCPPELLKQWFRFRGMANNTLHYISLINHIFHFKNSRIWHAYFVLSLLNNGYNYVDKYWLSFPQTFSFEFYGQNICCGPGSYDSLQNISFNNQDINNVLLYDCLFFEKSFTNLANLCYMTNSQKQSRWILKDGQLYFEKRDSLQSIQKEIDAFNKLKSMGFIVPDCTIGSYEAVPNKIRKPFNTIVKKCLVNDETFIIPCETIPGDPSMMLETLTKKFGFKTNDKDVWNAFNNYMANNKMDLKNVGFLIDNNVAKVAAWSNPIIFQ